MRRLDSLKTLSEDEKQLLRDLKGIVARFVPGAKVILYGSAARGAHGPESDYDVLILFRTPVAKATLEEMRSAIYDLELERAAVLSVMSHTEDEWNSPLSSVSPYHKNVEREGVLL